MWVDPPLWWAPHCISRPNPSKWLKACFRNKSMALVGDSMTWRPFTKILRLVNHAAINLTFDFTAPLPKKWHDNNYIHSNKSNASLMFVHQNKFMAACDYDIIFYNAGLHYLDNAGFEFRTLVRKHLDFLLACKPEQLWVRLISSINMDRVPAEHKACTNTRRVLELNNILRVEAKTRHLPVIDTYSTPNRS